MVFYLINIYVKLGILSIKPDELLIKIVRSYSYKM